MKLEIRAQPGPQTKFLVTNADVAIYGGAAGGGKTYGLLLKPLQNAHNPYFGCTIFRKNMTQVKNMGGLWDESMKLYSAIGGHPREFRSEWTFQSGFELKFGNLDYDKDVYNYQGAQIPLIEFDELTHFSRFQFTYMLSRNRSVSGVPGKVRATCNPDADSWLRVVLDWWIDPETGYAIPERSGVKRYFIVMNDEWIWGASAEELHQKFGYGPEIMPKSFTFIPSKLQDNKILMQKDPMYLANLLAQNLVERERLLGGNWNIRPSAGNYFQRGWMPIIEAVPSGWTDCIRFWDRAATKPNPANPDPDWTRGVKLYKYPDGRYVVGDLKSTQDTHGKVESLITTTASHDGDCRVMAQQDPGSAGVKEAESFTRMLSGYDVHTQTFSKDKVTRAKAVSAQSEAGNISVVRAPWNEEFFKELENFPDGKHDDIVDAFSGAFNNLQQGISLFDAT